MKRTRATPINHPTSHDVLPLEQEEALIAEQTAALAAAAAKQYAIDRAAAYGSIAEQLDMLYWDLMNGTDTWKDHVTAVKAAYPKPQ